MTIIFATGGSGGHVFPALRVAEELRDQKHEVFFLTTNGLAHEMIKERTFRAYCLNVRGVNTSSVINFFKSIFLMAKAFGQSFFMLKSIQPEKVIGFGGYVSFPVVVAAFFMRIPTAIHEQNVIPGKANLWASFFSKKIMISFEPTRQYFSCKKVVFVGCPCRDRVSDLSAKQIYQQFGLDQRFQTVLVVGGSQGSLKINQEFLALVLRGDNDFQFIHICGQKDYHRLNESYKCLKRPFFLTPFLNEIEQAYRIADIVIARGGASTICELLAFQKRSIIVPYPFAGGHQKANAQVLCDSGLATMVLDNELTSVRLGAELRRKLDLEMGDVKNDKRFHGVVLNASKKIAEVIRLLA
jgi:UDP-N-acetylglucosamine--N-acetylmuramyl-(pentapeptide) pyrophosphoryl-undecaprenol N-acetylglucosamine transferase